MKAYNSTFKAPTKPIKRSAWVKRPPKRSTTKAERTYGVTELDLYAMTQQENHTAVRAICFVRAI